jgi:predicted ATPase
MPKAVPGISILERASRIRPSTNTFGWRRASSGPGMVTSCVPRVFNVSTEIENLDKEPALSPPVISYYGGKSLHEQSHGEAFFALLLERFGGNGLYILDEPEAALSPQRQLAALARIHELVKDNSQFVIATHSPILMAYPDATIYACTSNGIEVVDYRETEHYTVTRDFLMNPERMLRELLD